MRLFLSALLRRLAIPVRMNWEWVVTVAAVAATVALLAAGGGSWWDGP
jgi:hypothetical protein